LFSTRRLLGLPAFFVAAAAATSVLDSLTTTAAFYSLPPGYTLKDNPVPTAIMDAFGGSGPLPLAAALAAEVYAFMLLAALAYRLAYGALRPRLWGRGWAVRAAELVGPENFMRLLIMLHVMIVGNNFVRLAWLLGLL
jgi:hypothetical protein